MTVELSAQVEKELHDLAERQGRKVQEIVEEAVRQYLQAAAITDLESAEVAEAQLKLVSELRDIPASLEDILGCLSYRGPAKTLEEMEAGIAEGARDSR